MTKELTVGVIGCGKIAESNHLPALLNIPGIRVAWLLDKDPRRSALLSEMYGLPVTRPEDFDSQLAGTDICLLTVPYGYRGEYMDKCARAGKALYVEKPFAVTYREHLDYCNRFPAHMLAIGFQRRFYQTLNTVHRIVESRLFGNLRSIEFNQGYFQLKGGGLMADAKVSGGGVIIESAIHSLDLILQLSGATAVVVTEASGIAEKGVDYDAHFKSRLSTPAGPVEVQCNVTCLRNLDNGVILQFDNAQIHFQPSPDAGLTVKTNNGESLQLDGHFGTTEADNCSPTVSGSFLLCWKAFIHGINTGQSNKTSAQTSLLTTQWIEQVYQLLNKS